jgi:hypothetical protein
VFTLTTPESQLRAAEAFILQMCPNGKRTYIVAGTSKWHLPSKEITLARVFEAMAGASEQGLRVLDWGVHSASLEDVFIQLAQEAKHSKHTEVVQVD